MEGHLWSCGWNEHGNLGRITVESADRMQGISGKAAQGMTGKAGEAMPGKVVGSYESAYDWVPVMRSKRRGNAIDRRSMVAHAHSSTSDLLRTTAAATATATAASDTVTATTTAAITATATVTDTRTRKTTSEYATIALETSQSDYDYEQVVLQVVWEGALSCGGGHCLCLTCDDDSDHHNSY